MKTHLNYAKTTFRILSSSLLTAVLLVSFGISTAVCQTPAPSPFAEYIARAKQQLDQTKIQVEQLKLQQAEFRATRNDRAAQAKDLEITRYQNAVTLKQQELSMYQQQENLSRQPLSPIPAVAAAQTQIRQWTYEKAQLGLRMTAANQAGNKTLADQLSQQINAVQLRITAKQQEIRLLEMKAKAGQ